MCCDFYVTRDISTEFPTVHTCASLTSPDPNGLLVPSGQMVRLKYGRIHIGSTVGQTIQQMKRECVLRSERDKVKRENRKRFVVFAFYFVCLRNLDFISLTNESP